MWTETSEGRKFIKDSAKIIIEELAPEELPLFDDLVDEYYLDPSPPSPSKNPNDDLLGFGLSEVLIAFTPAAIAALTVSLNYILTEVLKTTQDETVNVIKNKIRDLFGEKENHLQASPLSSEQLRIVKKRAKEVAIKFGVEPNQADLLSNALVGVLALDKHRK